MQFESQWPGDAITAPFCPADYREDALFEGPGGRPWNRVDSRADQADADPTVVADKAKPSITWLITKDITAAAQGPRRFGLDNDRASSMRLLTAALHPEFSLLGSEQARKERETRTAFGPLACVETARHDVAGRRTWIFSITSFFAEIWSRMLREREIRHIRAAWEMIDDRTLRDIGISRYEIEYAKYPRC